MFDGIPLSYTRSLNDNFFPIIESHYDMNTNRMWFAHYIVDEESNKWVLDEVSYTIVKN